MRAIVCRDPPMSGVLRDVVRVSRARWGNTSQTRTGSWPAQRPLGKRGLGKPLEGPSAALGQEDVADGPFQRMAPSRAVEGHGTCPRERRGLGWVGREAWRERVGMRFGSTAGLADAYGAEAGEENGAGSGQPWEEHIEGSSSPRRASPRGSSVARASNSFSKKKPTAQASVRNFLIQTCWPLIQKL